MQRLARLAGRRRVAIIPATAGVVFDWPMRTEYERGRRARTRLDDPLRRPGGGRGSCCGCRRRATHSALAARGRRRPHRRPCRARFRHFHPGEAGASIILDPARADIAAADRAGVPARGAPDGGRAGRAVLATRLPPPRPCQRAPGGPACWRAPRPRPDASWPAADDTRRSARLGGAGPPASIRMSPGAAAERSARQRAVQRRRCRRRPAFPCAARPGAGRAAAGADHLAQQGSRRRPGATLTRPLVLEQGSGRLVELPAPAFTMLVADPRIARVQPASPTSLFIMGVNAGRTNLIATREDGSLVAEFDITVAGRAAPARRRPRPHAAPGAGRHRRQVQSMIRRMVRGGAERARRHRRATGAIQLLPASCPPPPTRSAPRRSPSLWRGETRRGDQRAHPAVGHPGEPAGPRRRDLARRSRATSASTGWPPSTTAPGSSACAPAASSARRSPVTAGIGAALDRRRGHRHRRHLRRALQQRQFRHQRRDRRAGAGPADHHPRRAEPHRAVGRGRLASSPAANSRCREAAANNSTTVTVEYKPYGVSLAFIPTVLSPERLNMRVRPEVSELSETGAISFPSPAASCPSPA